MKKNKILCKKHNIVKSFPNDNSQCMECEVERLNKKPSPSTEWEKRIIYILNHQDLFVKPISKEIIKDIKFEKEKSVRETIRKVRKEFDKCLYDKQWVELATPENFEAGKISITLFEKKLSSLNPKGNKG